jgi:hypothetical protein
VEAAAPLSTSRTTSRTAGRGAACSRRLDAVGKPAKLALIALIALMRKRLVTRNAMLRTATPYSPHHDGWLRTGAAKQPKEPETSRLAGLFQLALAQTNPTWGALPDRPPGCRLLASHGSGPAADDSALPLTVPPPPNFAG